MSWSRSAALARHEVRQLRAEGAGLLSLVLMPVIMIAFLKPLARLALTDENPTANGSEFTVPAMATMFAFFLISMIGFSFLSERQYGTLERLRASQATSAEIMVGKVTPAFGLVTLQQALLFTLGVALFGLRPEGSVVALGAVVLAFCICLTSLGVLIAAIFKTNQQLNAFANIVAMVLAGVSGAFVPFDLLPSWARAVAPVSPQYWALRGYRAVILDGEGFAGVALPIGVLLLIAVAAAVIALLRFRLDEPTRRVGAAQAGAADAARAAV